MDEELHQKIFEPFFTTKEIGKGSGLGLSIVYGIAQQSKAQIVVTSHRTLGTIFSIYFPVVQNPEPAMTELDDFHIYHGTETVVLIDDNETICRLIQSNLSKAGYKVISYTQPTEFMNSMDSLGPEVHLMITDMVMPEMGGVELFQAVHLRYPHIKVLYISGFPNGEMEELNRLTSGEYCLSKPFTNTELLNKVSEILHQNQKIN
jgi:CheY-like chemotaxis protein